MIKYIILIFLLNLISLEQKLLALSNNINNKQTFAPYRPDYNPNFWDNKIDTLQFSEDQLLEFENIKNLPPIKCLRKAFDEYLSGSTNREYLENSAIGDSISITEYNGLKAFGNYYYKDKYLVLNFIEYPDDILEIIILPSNNPDIIFSAKMKKIENEEKYKLIDFHKSLYDDNQIHIIRNQLRNILKQDKYLF